MNIFTLGVFVLVAIAASEATVCTSNADCGAGSCCYIRPMFKIANKKRQLSLLATLAPHAKTGVCEMYKSAGDHCSYLATANGHCGCEPGTKCQWVPDPTTVAPGGRRSMIFHPEPGMDKCA